MSDAAPRLHYFAAEWCGVCREKAPLVAQLAAEAGLPLVVYDVDTDEGRAAFADGRMRGVPTLALHLGERVPFRLVGAMITRENVRHLLAMHVPSTSS